MANTQEVVVEGRPVTRRNVPEPEMKQYKLRAGATHHMDGEKVGPDEEVGLTDAEYAAFADKFEPTGKTSKVRRAGKMDKGVEDVDTPGVDDGNPPPPTARRVQHLPQDIGGKTPNLDAPPANPGNEMHRVQGSTVAGGVGVRPEALQSAGEGPKEEQGPGKDGPVKPGQTQPVRNVVEATNAGGPSQATENERRVENAETAATGKKDKTK